MAIAAGFVLRVFAGGAATGVKINPVADCSTFTLCLFIGFGKRKAEVIDAMARGGGGASRGGIYSRETLDPMLSISFAACFLCYLLYTVTSETAETIKTSWLCITAPFVFYCLFRFWRTVEEAGSSM